MLRSVAEREILFDAILVGFVDGGGAAQTTTALGIFALKQMPFARGGPQDLAAGGDFKSFRNRFFGLNTFWASHNQLSIEKERAI